jgi:TPP-dependent pyruvate/acetoin dehydrogenase alpha subunit
MLLTKEEFLEAYRTMRLIREFEESLLKLHGQAKVPGFVHVSVWQEAVSTGVALHLLPEDQILTTHRGHGDIIAKGVEIEGMYAELLARVGGYCGGKGGSMHVTDVSRGVLGANGIVGANMPIAAGAALSKKMRREPGVVVAFIGDGALMNGVTHETLNMASLWHLPLVIVRVDNQYAESTAARYYSGIPDVEAYVRSYGLDYVAVDGNDVDAVAEAAGRVVGRTRSGGGPGFLQARTYRRYGHNTADVGAYRAPEEVDAWARRDPLLVARASAPAHGVADAELDEIDAAVLGRIDRAIAWAETQPVPPLGSAFEDVYADPATIAAFGGTLG